jgi:hypothetical protein
LAVLAPSGAMIFASINGIPGVGFAELSSDDAGTGEHRGKIRVSAANAHRLRRLIDERSALVYYGPVWVEERWQLRSFPLDAADIQPLREDSFVVQFVEGDPMSKKVFLMVAKAPPG